MQLDRCFVAGFLSFNGLSRGKILEKGAFPWEAGPNIGKLYRMTAF